MDHHFSYAAGTGYRAVELPIGDGSLSMTVVVPDDLSSFVKGLTAAKLTTIDSQLSTYDVDLALPRFSADSRFDLAEVLKAMGMPTAFDSLKADLSGITTDVPLYIQHVVHEANIDVVEEGVTASAVTVAVMQAGSSGVQPPHVKFQVDKPFLYFIRDGATGTVLFVGRIVDPSAKS
jgi:serpin B